MSNQTSTTAKPKLSIIISHPIQHYCPMYPHIAGDDRVDLQVIFAEGGATSRFDREFGVTTSWSPKLLEGYHYTAIDAPKKSRPTAVVSKLHEFQPDVIFIFGYHQPYSRAAVRWAKQNSVQVLIATDSELLHPRPWYIRAIKRLVLPPMFRRFDLILTAGDENERYYAHYGVNPNRFYRVPFSIDSDSLDPKLERKQELRNQVRQELGIAEDSVVILSVGKLIARKGHADLIRAFQSSLSKLKRSATLVIAGEGAERPNLEKLIGPDHHSIKLAGFVNLDKLPDYYAASDIYAHPSSHDPHPLSITEAMYFGLPVVASDRVGSIGPTDDVRIGINGWSYPNGRTEKLSEILANLINDSGARVRAGAESSKFARSHRADLCAHRIVEASLLALERRNGAASEALPQQTQTTS